MAKTNTKEVSLYGGTEKITFYPDSHRYKKNDKWLKSVTGALDVINKPHLIFWAVNLACDHISEILSSGKNVLVSDIEEARHKHQDRLKEAGDLGTAVHKWAEDYIKGNNPDLPEDDRVLNGVTGFLQWVEEHKVKFVSSERLVYSKKYNFVGHMDAEAIIDGKLCVIDFKTSKKPKCQKCKGGKKLKTGGIQTELFAPLCKHKVVYPEWLFQTAAYQKAAQEEGTVYTGPRRIVRFDKENGGFEVYTARKIQGDWYAFLGALAISKRKSEL